MNTPNATDTRPAYRVRFTDEFGHTWLGATTYTGETAREDARKMARYVRSQIPYVSGYNFGTVMNVQVIPAT